MKDNQISRNLIFALMAVVLSVFFGCAIAKPHIEKQAETPIDWGLNGKFRNAITIEPFTLPQNVNKVLSSWASVKMQEHLLAEQAFERVIQSAKDQQSTPFVLKGEITHLYYGGTFTPTQVSVVIRIISSVDGQTRFLRKSIVKGENKGVDLENLSRAYVSSPYPEELLNKMLREIARDIAHRTNLQEEK